MSQGFIDSDTLGDLKPINQVVFSLGANLGNCVETLQFAVNRIAETPNIRLVDISPVYSTAPVGYLEQPDFFNLIVLADSTLEPSVLLDRAQAIEAAYGRERSVPNGPRTLDIDLIAVGRRTSDTERLVLPHPRAHERAFVLVPWLDVDPKAELPQGPVVQLVSQLDISGVRKLTDVEIVRP